MAIAMNPKTVSFTASPDHAATNPDGSPVVDHYDLQIFPQAGSTGGPTVVQSLGKPTPDGSNTITVPFTAAGLAALTPNVAYVAVVVAVGESGSTASVSSNPFARAAAPQAATNVVVQ